MFDDDDDDDDSFNDMSYDTHFKRSFVPLYLLSTWKEPRTTNDRISLAINLPSGVDVGDFSYRVVEGGREFEISVIWPKPLVDPTVLHKQSGYTQKLGTIWKDIIPNLLALKLL